MRLAALIVLLSGALFAQTAEQIGTDVTVDLQSGERLIGTLTEANDEFIVLQHPLFGVIQILRERIVVPEAEEAAVVPDSAVVEPANPWSGTFDFSINGSRGNNQKQDTRLAVDMVRDDDVTKDTVFVLWNKSTSEVDTGVPSPDKTTDKTADRVYGKARREWYLDDTLWRPFGQVEVDHDEFKDFRYRLTLIAGAAYPIIDEEKQKWDGRLGAGGSREFGGDDESWTPEALVGTNYTVEVMPLHTFGFGMDVFPDLEDHGEYRTNTQVKWEIAAAEESHWRFNFGVDHFYDSRAERPTRSTDVNYFIGAGRAF
ncbi:MAG: hypothetical protein DHS20C15_08850 [Planctomycetota bacterium]|nr:MAG: hypothetical protein DHS20C15_08850 [Planctomycetota bacterium]